MRRVLIVAYYFPPIGGIGSIRSARFAEYLPAFGWEPTVLAPRATPHPADLSLRYRKDRVVRSRSLELSRLSRAMPVGAATSGDPKRVSARERMRREGRRLVFPDAQVGWYPGAALAGLRLLRRERFDAIYSSSFPITAHVVARTLSRRAGLPWVAEFRDPWSDALAPDSPHHRRAAALETAIAERATELIMPTQTWASHFGARWGRHIRVIPNGFDAPVPPTAAAQPVTLTYLGTYVPIRQNLTPLWETLARLSSQTSSDREYRVLFIGEVPQAGRLELAAVGVDRLVHETGLVPHSEALKLLASSSLLVASGATSRDALGRGLVPAKIFEYLATSLPILYLGDPSGDAAALLAGQPGCYVVSPGEVNTLTEVLRTVGSGPRDHHRDVRHLSRRTSAGTLAQVLTKALGPAI